MSDLKQAAGELVNRLILKTQVASIGPVIQPGPFAELLKMVAHTGEIPKCGTCKHGELSGILVHCSATGLEWYPVEFCSEWVLKEANPPSPEPQGAIVEAPAGVRARGK